ncbi:MAG: glycerol-3-phosphate acyltransferase [Chloroflexi bacterium]|nr:glycerol-3-phosphate acyltransferase [Chloroflexota bacterium]
MIVNEVVTGLVALVIGYLLGSIPSAYIAARLALGRDIRRLGGGNVGGLNTYREVGIWAALAVAIVDFGKGVAAVSVAYWALALTDLSQPWVPAAGLMAVVGHNWMVWLKFSGGKGMGAAIGSLVVLLPLYGYWPGLLIFSGVIIVPFIITRNVALSMGIGLLSIPFLAWLGAQSGLFVAWSIVLGVIIGLKFLPTALAAWSRSHNKMEFIFDRGQRE